MKVQNIVLSRIKKIASECKKELIHFIFPAYCMHCQEIEIESSQLFCISCKEWIQRFPLDECLPFKAVAVEREGIALSLLRASKESSYPEVISTMAALMAFQIIDLKWPLPEIIIASPKEPVNILLALELSRFFKAPVKNCLKSELEWKRPEICSDQIVFLVDLILPFSSSWEILEEAAPLQIFQIGFCKAEAF